MRERVLRAAFLAIALMSQTVRGQTTDQTFIPERIFAGYSQGKGELRLLLGKPRPFTVESLGTVQAEGRFRLEQKVRFEGKAVQSRVWVMQQTRPGYYSATLTEAAGPAAGRAEGSRLTLRYPLKRWGLVMHQTLDLAKDGRTVANYGSIRLLGIEVGALRETIYLTH